MPPVVLITGASQGIGAAIAREFAAGLPGVRLALVARQAGRLAAVARSCRRPGAQAAVFVCDVSDEAAVGLMAAAVIKRFRRIDVLINNAGGFLARPFLETSTAEF